MLIHKSELKSRKSAITKISYNHCDIANWLLSHLIEASMKVSNKNR